MKCLLHTNEDLSSYTQHLPKKLVMTTSVPSVLRGQIPGAHWPARPIETANSGFRGEVLSHKIRRRVTEEVDIILWAPHGPASARYLHLNPPRAHTPKDENQSLPGSTEIQP